ncbi:hypothetical protein ACF0H5_009134 [Mactra antiquata]
MRFERTLNGFIDVCLGNPSLSSRAGSASVRMDMSDSSDDSDEFDNIPETEEGRLSRSLQSWMCNHTWTTVEPLEKSPRKPLFSGELGKSRKPKRTKHVKLIDARITNGSNSKPSISQRSKTNGTRTKINGTNKSNTNIQRVQSDDSITTSLSLLTCSSLEVIKQEEEVTKGKRKRKRKVLSRASTATSESSQPTVSKWQELSNKGNTNIKRMFRNQAAAMHVAGIIAGEDDNDESEAFQMFDKDEQDAVFKCGFTKGIKYVDKKKMKRSSSVTDVDKEEIQTMKKRKRLMKRVLSAHALNSWGPPLDVAQIKRDKMNQLIAAEQARQQQEKEKLRRARRHLMYRSTSQSKISTARPVTSSVTSAPPSVVSTSSNVKSVFSEHSSSDFPTDSVSEKLSNMEIGEQPEEVNNTVWKNDREILEIDLKKELTERVKERITTTRNALKLVTGYGEDNEQKKLARKQEEFPKHVEDDFCYKPRIIQKMRISPHLSGIIHDDIQVRMGRPRYHEIRTSDLDLWNKGQSLNRAHRNLKVFNWLHSLRDVTFTSNVIPEITDTPPAEDSFNLDLLHVESADEPDLKPLYRQYEVRIL